MIKFEAARIHFLKGQLQPVCTAVVHFTEINCCNIEFTNVIFVFENRIVSMFLLRRVSQPSIALNPIFKHNQNVGNFVVQQMISVKCTTAMHTS